MKKLYSKLLIVLSLLSPALVFAQVGQATNNLLTIISTLGKIVQNLIPIAFGLAILGFFWGLARYIFSAGNEESKVDGKKIMLYGLIAIFVMASVFGIVKLAQNTLGIDSQGTLNQGTITPPVVNIPQH